MLKTAKKKKFNTDSLYILINRKKKRKTSNGSHLVNFGLRIIVVKNRCIQSQHQKHVFS